MDNTTYKKFEEITLENLSCDNDGLNDVFHGTARNNVKQPAKEPNAIQQISASPWATKTPPDHAKFVPLVKWTKTYGG